MSAALPLSTPQAHHTPFMPPLQAPLVLRARTEKHRDNPRKHKPQTEQSCLETAAPLSLLYTGPKLIKAQA